MKQTFTLLLLITVLLITVETSLAQKNEFEPNWEIAFGMGQGFVDLFPNFGGSYSSGISYETEAIYHFSHRFAYSTSVLITTARYNRKNMVELNSDVIPTVFSHYQTVFSPKLLFAPLKTKHHEINLGVGPVFVFGHSQSSNYFRSSAPVLVKNFDEFGYLASFAYKFKFSKRWNVTAKYIFNQNSETTEHIMLSVGHYLK